MRKHTPWFMKAGCMPVLYLLYSQELQAKLCKGPWSGALDVTGTGKQTAEPWLPHCLLQGERLFIPACQWGRLTQYRTSGVTPGICKSNWVKHSQVENRVSEGSLEAKSHRGNEHLFTKSLNLPEPFLLPSEMNSPVRTKQVLGWICN